MSYSPQAIQKKLSDLVHRDPKKALVLGVLLTVLAGLAVKQFAAGGGPRSALASSKSTDALASAGDDVLKDGFSSPGAASQKLEQWLLAPVPPLAKNLFQFRGEFFPRTLAAVDTAASIVTDELFWDRLAKSITARADQRRQKQIRLENLQAAATRLKLQSTLMGTHPRAMIEGRLVRVGETVRSESTEFRLIGIEARRIVLERDGVKVEVPMGSNKVRVIADGE
jgi:hypothetical protein